MPVIYLVTDIFILIFIITFYCSATKFSACEVEKGTESEINADIGAVIVPSSLKHKLIVTVSTMKPLAVYSEISNNPDWQKILIFVNSR